METPVSKFRTFVSLGLFFYLCGLGLIYYRAPDFAHHVVNAHREGFGEQETEYVAMYLVSAYRIFLLATIVVVLVANTLLFLSHSFQAFESAEEMKDLKKRIKYLEEKKE